MNPDAIVNKLDECVLCHQIHLTVFEHGRRGGIWQGVTKNNLRSELQKISNNESSEETSGWKKHLDRWEAEGKIKKEDRE